MSKIFKNCEKEGKESCYRVNKKFQVKSKDYFVNSIFIAV